METQTLTVEEVATILRLSPDTVQRMCSQKRLPAFKAGHSWRIKKSDLDKYMETGASADGAGRKRKTKPKQSKGKSKS